MSPQAQLVMLLWLPIVLYLFSRFPPQRAIIISFIVAWLFLPQRAGFALPGIPDYDRMSATCYSILLATIIYHFQRLQSFRLGWLDIPIMIWCISPVFSSLTNDLGLYDGLSSALTQTVGYGFPYFLGRIYLNNLSGLRQLAIAIFTSGLIYVPLCLYEIRMSPQLHQMVYGYLGNPSFSQTYRSGGYRPTVFMQHGLSVGMWMMAATLIGIWLWQTGVLKKFWNVPMQWLSGGLLITFILVRSTGAYVYLFLGLLILFSAKWLRSSIIFLVLILGIIFYLGFTATGSFTTERTEQVTSIISQFVETDRVTSLKFRFDNEEILVQKALEKPLFGWGGWGRNRIYEANWEGQLVDVSTTDSLWIISYGQRGIIGLFSIFAASLLPALSFFWLLYPARFWHYPQVAPAAVIAVVIVLYMLDCLLNNQYNPVFMLASGGLAGLVLKSKVEPRLSGQKLKKLFYNRIKSR